ncbi:MAG: dipicolinate synthase subunit B [Massiliimalia sp.]
MSKVKLGFCLTGSFCTFHQVIKEMEQLAQEYDILPIMSYHAASLDTRFGKACDHIQAIEEICGKKVIATLPEAEPIGPKGYTDLMLVAPCTGNTLAKLANSIVDTPVTMAVKSHLRNGRPVVIAVSTNDGLSGASKNIGMLQNYRHYYFVPYRQDDFMGKPCSLVADFKKIPETLQAAQQGIQLEPLLLTK